MINKAIIIGNLGNKPELKYTPSGQAVLNIRIATSEKYTDKQGNKQDKTEWHNVVIFGKQAEKVAQYSDKGDQLYVEGKIQTRQWQGKEGDTRYITEILADETRFLSSKLPSERNTEKMYQDRIDLVNAEKSKARANDPSASYNQQASFTDPELPF